MSGETDYEIRVPPADESLAAEARSNPGGWVYDIDFDYGSDEAAPSEAIRGAWEVSALGALTGRYKKNGRYRAVIECDRALKSYVHAAAKHTPGKWVVEIDPCGEDLFPNIPDELIVGWWLVGRNGEITRYFRENSLYKGSQ